MLQWWPMGLTTARFAEDSVTGLTRGAELKLGRGTDAVMGLKTKTASDEEKWMALSAHFER